MSRDTGRVPNQPRTPIRGVRVSDDLWQAAQAVAAERGESVSDVIRDALAAYVAASRSSTPSMDPSPSASRPRPSGLRSR